MEWTSLTIISILANFAIVVTVIVLVTQAFKKNKLESIKLTREILNVIKKDPDLKLINNQINNYKEELCSHKQLILFLNEYDDLALYWKEKLIHIKHVRETHGAILRKIRESERIRDLIKKTNDDDINTFTNLIDLLRMI